MQMLDGQLVVLQLLFDRNNEGVAALVRTLDAGAYPIRLFKTCSAERLWTLPQSGPLGEYGYDECVFGEEYTS